jgi:hypothetical protein
MGYGYAESQPQSSIERLLGSLGKGAGKARSFMDNVTISGEIPFTDIGGKVGLGELLFQQAPEMLNEMSWGKSMIQPTGHGGKLDPRMMDIAEIAFPGAILGKKMAKEGIKDLFKQGTSGAAESGYIMGLRAKGADITKLNLAERMKKDGATEAQIFARTKWWLEHPDGKPRWEKAHGAERYIDSDELASAQRQLESSAWKESAGDINLYENTMRTDPYLQELDRVGRGGITRHDERMINSPYSEQYDPMGHTGIRSLFDPGPRGSYNRTDDVIEIQNRGPDFAKEMQSTAQHETQHAISSIEKMAPGGSVQGIHTKIYNKLNNEHTKLYNLYKKQGNYLGQQNLDRIKYLVAEKKRLGRDFDNISDEVWDEMYQKYLRLADESQARLTQNRAHMTQTEMDANPFYKEYPVLPKDMFIVDKYTGLLKDDTAIGGILGDLPKRKNYVER